MLIGCVVQYEVLVGSIIDLVDCSSCSSNHARPWQGHARKMTADRPIAYQPGHLESDARPGACYAYPSSGEIIHPYNVMPCNAIEG